MIENEKYLAEYNEVKEKYQGADVKTIRKDFAYDITHIDKEYIDTNYKDILVTFNIKYGVVYLSDLFELYDENDNFVGTMYSDGRINE